MFRSYLACSIFEAMASHLIANIIVIGNRSQPKSHRIPPGGREAPFVVVAMNVPKSPAPLSRPEV